MVVMEQTVEGAEIACTGGFDERVIILVYGWRVPAAPSPAWRGTLRRFDALRG
jgi:hypothetical protein